MSEIAGAEGTEGQGSDNGSAEPDVDAANGDASDSGVDDFEAITSQEQLNKIVGGRVKRAEAKAAAKFADYDDLKAKADKYEADEAARAEKERARMSDQQKYEADKKAWDKERSELTEKVAAFERSQLRSDVAAAKNVPAGLVHRLQGSTIEELEADADKLMAEFANPTPGGRTGERLNPTGGGKPPVDEMGEFDPEKIAEKFLAKGY